MCNQNGGCHDDGDLSDEQLIALIRSGDETSFEKLSKRYAALIYGKAAEFSNSISFKTYLNRCIFNKLSSVYANEKRKKKIPYNCMVPIDDSELSDIGGVSDPEQQLIDNEGFADLQKKIKKSLSSFEQKVLSHYLSGSSYVQTARSLNTTVKAVDNALSRIRKKLRCI